MAINKRIKFIRGNTAANDAFTGYEGEFTVDTTNWTIRLHDGINPGGHVVGGSFDYDDLTNKPTLFSGSYTDLTDKPTGLASETYVDNAINSLVSNAPDALNTLDELANALSDDANFAATVTSELGNKVDSSSLSTVATSGDYADLANKPSIPVDIVDLTDTTSLLSRFSGSWDDLTNKPVIFDGYYSSLIDTPTSLAGYGITDAQPLSSALTDISNVDLNAGTQLLVANGTGDIVARTPLQARSDLGLHAVASSGDYTDLTNQPTIPTVPTNISAFTNDAGYLSSTVSAPIKVEGVSEKFSDKQVTGSGVWTFDCIDGNIFTVSGMTANFTPNFINLDLDASFATTITLVLTQGATAYVPNAMAIDGLTKTIRWQGSTTPTGTADSVDVVTFSILNVEGLYTVLGQLVDF